MQRVLVWSLFELHEISFPLPEWIYDTRARTHTITHISTYFANLFYENENFCCKCVDFSHFKCKRNCDVCAWQRSQRIEICAPSTSFHIERSCRTRSACTRFPTSRVVWYVCHLIVWRCRCCLNGIHDDWDAFRTGVLVSPYTVPCKWMRIWEVILARLRKCQNSIERKNWTNK